MQIELNEAFYNEIQQHYAKGMTEETYTIGDIHCWAFVSNGREMPGIVAGKRIFSFCKPFGHPIYAYVNEDTDTDDIMLDTVDYAFVKKIKRNDTEDMEIEVVEKHSQEVLDTPIQECEDCSC